MGFEILDFTFRIEKALKIKIDWNEIGPLSFTRNPPDLSVGEIHHWLVKVWDRSEPCYVKRWSAKPFSCGVCKKAIKKVPIPGFCGRCGAPVTAELYVWDAMVDAMLSAAGMGKETITKDALIHKDLGMG